MRPGTSQATGVTYSWPQLLGLAAAALARESGFLLDPARDPEGVDYWHRHAAAALRSVPGLAAGVPPSSYRYAWAACQCCQAQWRPGWLTPGGLCPGCAPRDHTPADHPAPDRGDQHTQPHYPTRQPHPEETPNDQPPRRTGRPRPTPPTSLSTPQRRRMGPADPPPPR